MVGVFEILVAVIAAWVARDELLLVVEADPIGIGLYRQTGTGIFGGHRIAVSIEGHPELLGSAHRGDRCAVVGYGGQGFELGLFFLKALHRRLVGLAMEAHIG